MAENYFDLYCDTFGITDPFQESQERFNKKTTKHFTPSGGEYWEVDITKTAEDLAWEKEWEKRRDAYLRLEHIFRLWEFHDIVSWDYFQKEIAFSKCFTDDGNRYLPCDCEERQCAMTCTYFGTKCPRANGEPLYPPEEVMKVWDLEQELKWEEHDDCC